MPRVTISRQKAVEWIRAQRSRFFSVTFRKRSDGSRRTMLCRLGVTKHLKGGKPSYDASAHDLITVWDRFHGYRCIPVEGLQEVTINGVKHEVV